MAVDIVMPQMGESIFEGTITKWLKKPGDKVERDEPLFEISTDKVDAEIPVPSRAAGERIHSSPLVRRMAKERGIDLATIPGTGAGGRISKQDIEAYLAGGAQPSAEVAEPAAAAYAPPAPAPQRAAAPPPPPPATSGGQVHVAFESAVPREKMYFGNYEVQPMSIMRQRIAEHMVASKRVSAHVYS